jgi:hypothetical protein
MGGRGFERILAIPAVPSGNNTGHRYVTSIVTDSGEDWSLRSMGMGFSLVTRSWLRSGMTRCYSLGWGLTAHGQTGCLLLAQAFELDVLRATRLGGDLGEALRPLSSQVTWAVSELWGRQCLRMAAEVRETCDR